MRSLLLAILVATSACHANHGAVEPQLAGGESPAAFERSIGLTLLRTSEPRRALPYLERLARLEPQGAQPLFYIGRAYMDMEMWQQARSAIDRALVLEPKFAPVHDLLGVLLDARGRHVEAVAAHRRAIALDPDNAPYRNNLGFSFYLGHKYVDAVAAYESSLRIEPNASRVHNNLGFALAKLGRIDAASEHFRLAGTPAEAANNLGLVYEERGDLQLAYESYTSALAVEPDLAVAQGNLARIAERINKPIPGRD